MVAAAGRPRVERPAGRSALRQEARRAARGRCWGRARVGGRWRTVGGGALGGRRGGPRAAATARGETQRHVRSVTAEAKGADTLRSAERPGAQCTAHTVAGPHAATEQRSDAQHPGQALRSHVTRSAASGRVPHSVSPNQPAACSHSASQCSAHLVRSATSRCPFRRTASSSSQRSARRNPGVKDRAQRSGRTASRRAQLWTQSTAVFEACRDFARGVNTWPGA